MKRVLLIGLIISLLIGCTNPSQNESLSQAVSEEPATKGYQCIKIVDEEQADEMVMLLIADPQYTDNLFSSERLRAMNQRLQEQNLIPVQICVVTGYDYLNQTLLNTIAKDLGQEWDVLYFKEEAFGNHGFEELFLPLTQELTDGKLWDAYQQLPISVWNAMRIDGENYNLAQPLPAVSVGVQPKQWYLAELNVEPEQLYQQEEESMKDIFNAIYQASNQLPFLSMGWPGTVTQIGNQACMTDFLGIESQYHMICPFVGISAEQEGKAVSLLDDPLFDKMIQDLEFCYEQGYGNTGFKIWTARTGKSISEMYEPSEEADRERGLMIQTVYGPGIGLYRSLNQQSGYQIPLGKTTHISSVYAQPYTVVSKTTPHRDAVLETMNFLLSDPDANAYLAYREEYEKQSGILQTMDLEWDGLATTPVLTPSLKLMNQWPAEEKSDVKKVMEETYQTVELGSSVGFVLDPAPVQEQIQRINQETFSLTDLDWTLSMTKEEFPLARWQDNLEEMRERLSAAGLQEVVDEVNRQLINWRKN